IVDVLRGEPFHAAQHTFPIGASIGVRPFGGGQETPETLLAEADAACYAAKRGGRGRVEMAAPGEAGPVAPLSPPCASPPAP
ncbi:diguanylate cyclase, partial [Corallococcus coralloides]|nr:diguanylate cyclase [Corallococcus coralloides]